MAQRELSKKVVVVTGAAGGIGAAICHTLAKEGASIAMVDLDKSGLDKILEEMTCSEGNSHYTIKGDISRLEDITNIFQAVEDHYGKKCTVLINNAGVDGKQALVGEFKEQDIDIVLNVNLRGTILMTNEFVRRLKTGEDSQEQIGGCVVNISSTAGKLGVARGAIYAATKAGILGFTKSLAREYPDSKVRCNAIMPGAVDTPMLTRVRQALPYAEQVFATIPVQRLGQPQDIAEACLYLVSDRSSYVNGDALQVSGGFGC